MRTVVLHRPHAGEASQAQALAASARPAAFARPAALARPAVLALAVSAIAVLTIGGLSGCVTTASAPEGTPSSAPSPVPSASLPFSKPLFSTDNQALMLATDAYAAYLRVSDEIFAEGGLHPERLRQVATGEALTQLEPDFLTYAERHWHITGNTAFDSVRLQSSSARVVTIYVCEDVSNVNVIDASGASLVGGSGDTRLPFQAQLVQRARRLVLASKTAWTGADFCR